MEDESEDQGGRFLTDDEKLELGRIARKSRRSAWVLPVLCWVLTAMDLVSLGMGAMHGFQLFAFGLLLIVTITVTVKLWQALQLRSQMLNDLDLGTLVNDRMDGERVEHLPVSSLLWTVNGEPAPWRQSINRSN